MEPRRFLRIGLCLWGAALPLSAASRTEAPTVRLRTAGFDLVHLNALTGEVMIRELNRLLAAAETRVEWRWAPPGTEAAPDELRVVFLDSPARGTLAGYPILGTTATGHSGPPPIVWIHYPTVVRVLGLRAESLAGSFFAMRGLGVALGRVVAHELVHALAPEVPHTTGLMAPGLRPQALLGPPLVFDARSATTFGAAARSWWTWGASPPDGSQMSAAECP
jgi:hypothetical protein